MNFPFSVPKKYAGTSDAIESSSFTKIVHVVCMARYPMPVPVGLCRIRRSRSVLGFFCRRWVPAHHRRRLLIPSQMWSTATESGHHITSLSYKTFHSEPHLPYLPPPTTCPPNLPAPTTRTPSTPSWQLIVTITRIR